MAATMSFVLTLLALGAFPLMSQGTIVIDPYYMNTKCGKTVQISETSMKSMYLFMSTNTNTLRPSCHMTIEAPPGYRLLFTIRSLRMSSVFSCLESYLEIHDGRSEENLSVTGKICDDRDPTYTTGRHAYLRYLSSSLGDKFEVVVTAYRDNWNGICKSDEFSCNNGRCISSGLTCNYRDNCGDNSNNDNCGNMYHPGDFWWVWMLIGILVFILLVSVIIAVSCCLCCKNRRPGTVLSSGQVFISPVPYSRQHDLGKDNVIVMPQTGTQTTTPEKKVPL